MTVHDTISPAAWTAFQLFGYGLMLVVVTFVLCAGLRAYGDTYAAYKRSRWY